VKYNTLTKHNCFFDKTFEESFVIPAVIPAEAGTGTGATKERAQRDIHNS
jgi:hypothetical protein